MFLTNSLQLRWKQVMSMITMRLAQKNDTAVGYLPIGKTKTEGLQS